MYGGLVFLVILIVRIMARRRGQRTIFDWALPNGTVLLMVRAIALMLALELFLRGNALWFALTYLLIAVLHPFTRWFVVPLGVPHLSYVLTRVAFFGGGRNEAVFNELLARLRRPSGLEPEQLANFATSLFQGKTDKKVRGISVAVRATLDAVAGDIEQARALFRLTAELNWRLAPRYVRAYAQAWLMAEAARRGAWHEVVRISRRGPWTRRAFFYRAAARRIMRCENELSDLALACAWLVSPNRVACLPLFNRACSGTPREPLEISSESLQSVRRSTHAALRLCPGSVTRTEIRSLAEAWQEIFDCGEHEEFVSARARELGMEVDATQVASEFESDVISLLTELWRSSLPERLGDGIEPALVVAAKDQLQFELLGAFETIADRLRTEDAAPKQDDDDYEPYWRSWARLRSVARDYLDVLPERGPLLCDAGCTQVLSHGAWLYNGRQARALAHDVFRWLLPQFPKGSENYRIVKRNVRISQDA